LEGGKKRRHWRGLLVADQIQIRRYEGEGLLKKKMRKGKKNRVMSMVKGQFLSVPGQANIFGEKEKIRD